MSKPIHPKDLLSKANETIENGAFDLEDYAETMWKFHNIGWSFRRIAKWMSQNGVECSHNQVYYVLKRDSATEEDATGLDVDYQNEDESANFDPNFDPKTH